MAGTLITLGGLAGAAAVALGAIGAHWLRPRVPDSDYEIFTVAIGYLLVHAVLLCGCGDASRREHAARVPFTIAGLLLIAGIVLFCGGLIGRVMLGMPALGQFAPVGGTALIAAWLAIAAGGVMTVRRGR